MQEKSTRELEQDERLEENLSKIKNKLIIISGKGGVGKTTVAVNLAYDLAIRGKNFLDSGCNAEIMVAY